VLGGGIRRERILIYLSFAALVWTSVVLCNSRGGMISLTFQSAFLFFVGLSWYSARKISRENKGGLFLFVTSRLARTIIVIVIVGTLVLGFFWMGGDSLSSKLAAQVSRQETVDGTTRKIIWHSTWELFKHNKWTGVGFGAYFLGIPEYLTGSGRLKLEQAHNDYLDLAASGGLFGIGLAAWFIVMVMRRARKSLQSADLYRRAASLGAAAGILGVMVHSLVDFGLQLTGLAVVFASLIVIMVAAGRLEKEEGHQSMAELSTRM